jgi:adenine phosphoribosyltransferase
MHIDDLKNAIRDVVDFPKPGIVFKDITPILQDPTLFAFAMNVFVKEAESRDISKVAAIDARGFIFGGILSDRLGCGFVPIRKEGKLPYKTFSESYTLEYGEATLCVHQDAFENGERVLLIDDLLATGGSSAASVNLIEKAGGKIAQIQFLIELAFLKGRERLTGYDVFAPMVF